jgi:hypothetical protein
MSRRWAARFGGALACGAIAAALPAIATGAVLFDHTDPTPGGSTPSQLFEPAYASTENARAMDDFRVPSGEVWEVDRVIADGVASGAATSALVTFDLYEDLDAPPNSQFSLHGDNSQTSTVPYPDLAADLSAAPYLPPGDYWISIQADLDFSPGNNRWYWAENDSLFEDYAIWQENGAYATGCSFLQPRAPNCFPGSPPDQSFVVEGESVPEELRVLKVKAKPHGKLRVRMSLPSCCALKAKSKQMRRLGRAPKDNGEFTATLKPKPKVRDALDAGKDVTAKVKLSVNGLLGGPQYTAELKQELKR